MPSAAPAPASRALSTSNWRTMRLRLAPSAARSARSCSRRASRASIRFATFAHAIKSTKPTAPISTASAGLMPPVSTSESGTTRHRVRRVGGRPFTPQLRLHLLDVGPGRVDRHAGFDSAERLQMLAVAAGVRQRSLVADERPHLRALIETLRDERLERRRHHADDRERLIVHGDDTSDCGRVGVEAAAPEAVAQHHQAPPLGVSSSARKSRPSAGRTPSM